MPCSAAQVGGRWLQNINSPEGGWWGREAEVKWCKNAGPPPTLHQLSLPSERLLALAEASVTESCGRAVAAGMRRKAEVYSDYNDAALVWHCVQLLPHLAGKFPPTRRFAKFSQICWSHSLASRQSLSHYLCAFQERLRLLSPNWRRLFLSVERKNPCLSVAVIIMSILTNYCWERWER